MAEPVTRSDWKNLPFEGGELFAIDLAVTQEEFDRIKLGLLPFSMEDKWFILYEDPYLYLHRSWTGRLAYRLAFTKLEDGAYVSEAILCMNDANWSNRYHAAFVDFLINRLLLGKDKLFPIPETAKGEEPGLFQASMCGTGFPEVTIASPKPWWRFW